MRKFLMALMSALLLLSTAAAGVSAAGGEESALELLAGQGKTLAAGAIAYNAADSSAAVTDRTDGSWDFEGLKLSGKVMAADGTVKELSELTLSYSARFSALDPGENPQGYYGVGLNLSSAGTDMQRVRLWQDGGVYVQATEKTVFTESGNLDSAASTTVTARTAAGCWRCASPERVELLPRRPIPGRKHGKGGGRLGGALYLQRQGVELRRSRSRFSEPRAGMSRLFFPILKAIPTIWPSLPTEAIRTPASEEIPCRCPAGH